MNLKKIRLCSLALSMLFSISVSATEVVTVFNPDTDGIPEAIASDYRGDIYASIGRSVRKYTPEGKLLNTYDLPVSTGIGNGDMIIRWDGNIFVNSHGDTIVDKGVWRIDEHGQIEKFASFDPTNSGFLNGMTIDYNDNLYVSDSQFNKIYKIDPEGGVSDWLEDEKLAGDGSVHGFVVGVNNLALSPNQRFIYASNLDQGTILRIRIKRDGSAGRVKIVANDPVLKGIDGITFNRRGELFAAINATNKIVKISRRGKVKIIEDAQTDTDSLLDFPSDIVFGKGRDSFTMYITNFSLFTREFPAILKLDLHRDEAKVKKHKKSMK